MVRARVNQRRLHDWKIEKARLREHVKGFLVTLEKRGVLERLVRLINAKYELGKPPPDSVVSLIAEGITHAELRRAYPESAGFEVLADVQIARRVEGYTSKQAWQDANPGKDSGAIREAGGVVWEAITDVDGMAVWKDAKGKWRIIEMEQTKSGRNDTPSKAAAQNDRALAALRQVASGAGRVEIFLVGQTKQTLGARVTDAFNLERLDVRLSTRGPAGAKPAFDKDLYGMSRDNLEQVAKVLIDGLTPLETPLKSLPVVTNEDQAGQELSPASK